MMPYYLEPYGSLLADLAGKLTDFSGTLAYTQEQADYRKVNAYLELKTYTGQDFGYDVEKWRAWLEEHPDWMNMEFDPIALQEFREWHQKYPSATAWKAQKQICDANTDDEPTDK